MIAISEMLLRTRAAISSVQVSDSQAVGALGDFAALLGIARDMILRFNVRDRASGSQQAVVTADTKEAVVAVQQTGPRALKRARYLSLARRMKRLLNLGPDPYIRWI